MKCSIRYGRLAVLSVALYVCLLPSSAAAQERARSALTLPTIAAGAAATADWVTTYHALTNYRVREVNPLLQPFNASPGQLVSVGAAMDIGGVTAWNMLMGPNHAHLAVAGLWAMTAFRSYLAVHNLRNEQRAAHR